MLEKQNQINTKMLIEEQENKITTDNINTIEIKQLNENKQESKIYCANCTKCRVIKVNNGVDNQYVLRIKCQAKQWKKKLGEEKLYKFFTVSRRIVEDCKFYDPMGCPKEYLKELRKTLPVKDEIYTL